MEDHIGWFDVSLKEGIIQIAYCLEDDSREVRSINADNSKDKLERVEFQTNSMGSNRQPIKDMSKCYYTNTRSLKKKCESESLVTLT